MNKLLRNRMSKAILALKAEGKSVADVADKMAELAEMHYRPPGNDVQTAEVYLLYPRKAGGATAKSAICRAIKRSGYEVVLEGTKKYKACIGRYGIDSKHDKYHLLPNCTTFFNQDRYLLDESEWSAPFRGCRYVDQAEHSESNSLKEPLHWKDAMNDMFGFITDMDWSQIDNETKQEVREHLEKG